MQAAASPHLEVTFPHSRSFPVRPLDTKIVSVAREGVAVGWESDRGVEGFVVNVN